MGFQIKLLGFVVLLLLTLSFCQAKNVTVKLVGVIHCTDCIRHESSNSQASLGVDVLVLCNSKNRETRTQGNGAIDKEGKFNVTLSAEIKEDGYAIDGCFAKLQTASSTSQCPIQSAQTASVELLSTDENAAQAAHNRPTIITFSPVTCQSAFFWPRPNFTFFPASPPPPEQPVEHAPPPSETLPPLAPPAESPLPPVEDLVPPPAPASEPSSYSSQVPSLPPTLSPPAPETEAPSPLPDLNLATPPPAPAPTFHIPPNPTIKNPTPPPVPTYNAPPPPPPLPPQSPPLYKPIPTKKHHSNTPAVPPTPSSAPPPPSSEISNPPPPPLAEHEKPMPPSSPTGISTPPTEKKPHPIPRAPPVPRLPPIPQVPRKYFNPPKSKSKPPHSS